MAATARALGGRIVWAPVPKPARIAAKCGATSARSAPSISAKKDLQIRTIDPARVAARQALDRASHARGRRFETRRAHHQKAPHLWAFVVFGGGLHSVVARVRPHCDIGRRAQGLRARRLRHQPTRRDRRRRGSSGQRRRGPSRCQCGIRRGARELALVGPDGGPSGTDGVQHRVGPQVADLSHESAVGVQRHFEARVRVGPFGKRSPIGPAPGCRHAGIVSEVVASALARHRTATAAPPYAERHGTMRAVVADSRLRARRRRGHSAVAHDRCGRPGGVRAARPLVPASSGDCGRQRPARQRARRSFGPGVSAA